MHNKFSLGLLVFTAAINLQACSGKEPPPSEVKEQDKLFQPQRDTLDKAKQVDVLIQQDAEKQRKQLEQDSQ